MRPLLAADIVRGMAHITGGGFEGNIPRMLPRPASGQTGLAVELQWGTWAVPPIFGLIQNHGRIDFAEMTRVFNLGLGWLFVTAGTDADDVHRLAPDALLVGRVVEADGSDRVRLLGAP
jgi:phosphoribosylformylglycinamidine cyclo-ligase